MDKVTQGLTRLDKVTQGLTRFDKVGQGWTKLDGVSLPLTKTRCFSTQFFAFYEINFDFFKMIFS